MLIKKVVRFVSDKLISTSKNDPRSLIGMDSYIEEIYSFLSLGSEDARMMGIWGMGGIGKTTIAKFLFDRLSSQFQGSCFIENVKGKFSTSDPLPLQEKLLSDILCERNVKFWGLGDGSYVIKERLQHKKILLILDDVDQSEQLDIFAKEIDWFGPGTRVIITTRDRHLLDAHGMEYVYEVKCLKHPATLQVFNHYAFKNMEPVDDFLDVSEELVGYAGGLPLALKVLGSYVCGKNIPFWKHTSEKLANYPITYPIANVIKVLKFSYDGLDEHEKNIFLYVACLFEMDSLNNLTRELDSCGYSTKLGVQVLEERSLLEISTDGIIRMHELLREMGKKFVPEQCSPEPGKRKILWDPREIRDVLIENSGTETLEAISLNTDEVMDLPASRKAFKRMSNLKFLRINNKSGSINLHFPAGLQYLPRKLRYLEWHGYPLKALPPTFCPEFLVEINMSKSCVEYLWKGIEPLVNLKRMDLSYCENLKQIPDLSKATNLETLKMSNCINLAEVPSSIKNLHKLTKLDMSECSSLKTLPSNINLKSLESLHLGCITGLNIFPEFSWNIRKLNLHGANIEEVPATIKHFHSLVRLNLSSCKRLKHLPSSLGSLTSLVRLNLSHCEELESIPRSIGKLRSLIFLMLDGCKKLKNVPRTIFLLNSLGILNISLCPNITMVPRLPRNIACLDMSGTGIEEIPSRINNLTRLVDLRMSNCRFLMTGLETRHSFCISTPFAHLKLLSLGRPNYKSDGVPVLCPLLSYFPALEDLSLRSLNIQELPNHFPKSLNFLDLSGNNFQTLPGSIKENKILKRLDISYCENLQSLPELPRDLGYIYAHNCVSLERISPSNHKLYGDAIFSNCFKLDNDAQLCLQQLCPAVCLPGSKVPECFNYQTKGPRLTISLPYESFVSEGLPFAACLVVDGCYSIHDMTVVCRFHIKGLNDFWSDTFDMIRHWSVDPNDFWNVKSCHMFFFHQPVVHLPTDVQNEINMRGGCVEISFDFSLEYGVPNSSSIKECGIRFPWMQHKARVLFKEKELELNMEPMGEENEEAEEPRAKRSKLTVFPDLLG